MEGLVSRGSRTQTQLKQMAADTYPCVGSTSYVLTCSKVGCEVWQIYEDFSLHCGSSRGLNL